MGAGAAAVSPLAFGIMERVQPAAAGSLNYARTMRLAVAIGLAAGALTTYQRSCSELPFHHHPWARKMGDVSVLGINWRMERRLFNMSLPTDRFYGFTENKREEQMDMDEMVDKVKRGEPLYGVSELSPYMQGVAARNSRYSSLFIHAIPWFNMVNHNQV